jgi:Icc-related predicted phosphoesterase
MDIRSPEPGTLHVVRLLALADRPPHGDLVKLAKQQDVDVVVTLGDLQPSWIERLDGLQVPKLGVYGNHDEEPYMTWFGIEDMHMRHVHLDGGPTVTGFEGCVSYRHPRSRTGPSYSQRQARKLMRRLPPADIVLVHCPPYGVNDEPDDAAHVGFEALRDWVLEHRPKLLLHGHTHPQPGTLTDRLGDTRIVYVHGARVVDVPEA